MLIEVVELGRFRGWKMFCLFVDQVGKKSVKSCFHLANINKWSVSWTEITHTHSIKTCEATPPIPNCHMLHNNRFDRHVLKVTPLKICSVVFIVQWQRTEEWWVWARMRECEKKHTPPLNADACCHHYRFKTTSTSLRIELVCLCVRASPKVAFGLLFMKKAPTTTTSTSTPLTSSKTSQSVSVCVYVPVCECVRNEAEWRVMNLPLFGSPNNLKSNRYLNHEAETLPHSH